MVDSFNINTAITHVADVIGSVERIGRRVHFYQVCSPGVCKTFVIDSWGVGCGCVVYCILSFPFYVVSVRTVFKLLDGDADGRM